MNANDISAWVDKHLVRLGQSAFRLTASDGTVLYLDVFRPQPAGPHADWLFFTHDHGDHFSPAVARSLMQATSRVVTPLVMREKGADAGLATDTLAPGETKNLGKFTVTAVAAYNLTRNFHPRTKNYVGYVFEVDGIRIYHAGDTDLVPEMTGLQVDLALLPVGGLMTMHWNHAVEASAVLGNPVVVPMHYGLIPFTAGKGRRFAGAYSGTTKLL